MSDDAVRIDFLRDQLWLRPHDHALILELAGLYQKNAQIKPALELLLAAVRRAPHAADLHAALGQLFLELADWDKAERHFTQAEDEAGLQQLAAARQQMPSSYARHLFNDYAPHFDAALAKLGYQAPQQLAQVLAPFLHGKSGLTILDLGCGTGLMAPYLRPHADRLVGVDIAEKMLEQAQQRGGYDELAHADITAYLGRLPSPPDLIVAADVLVYLGDLAPLFGALPKGVLFAATVEVNGLTEGYQLQESKRYAHSRAYIESLTTDLRGWQEVVLRHDRGAPVNGAVFLLRQ